MRLATFNILHGRSLADGRVSTQRLVDACASLEADVLCLQEIDRGQARSGHADQTAAIAEGMGAAAWRFQPAIVGEPGGRWRAATEGDLQTAEPGYGVAIVSRLPVLSWDSVTLGAAPVKSPVYVPGARPASPERRGRFILLPDEPRVALVADLGDIVVVTAHLSFVPAYNLVQLRKLVTQLAAVTRSEPCLLLGDLNVPGPLPAWVSRWHPLATARTFPADTPRLQVDHILASDRRLQAASGPASAPRLPVSDHRPLTLDLNQTALRAH